MKFKKRVLLLLSVCFVAMAMFNVYFFFIHPGETDKSLKNEERSMLAKLVQSNFHDLLPISGPMTALMREQFEVKIEAKIKQITSSHFSFRKEFHEIRQNLVNDVKNIINLRESPWTIAASWMTSRHIHPEHTPQLGAILQAMATSKILQANIAPRGTQLKASLILEGGQKVIFKPLRFSRDYIVTGAPYAGADRHNGEIAAFHLNRVLGFCRTPIVVGRKVNLRSEIMSVAHKSLLDTFFVNGSNLCFYGKCYYCNINEPACADEDILEGALVLWMAAEFSLKLDQSPWQRTYNPNKTARWEKDNLYCEKLQKMPIFYQGPRLLDLIDAAVFDYLMGNADRHHYETFIGRNDSIVLLLDNGKSFGNPFNDEVSILAPLYQCCRIRKSTWNRLQILIGGILSETLKEILSYDPITPILSDPHYKALDRRLLGVIATVEICFDDHGEANVVIDDGF